MYDRIRIAILVCLDEPTSRHLYSEMPKKVSAAKSILATLWSKGESNLREMVRSHRQYKSFNNVYRNTFQTSLVRLQRNGLIQKKKRGIWGLTSEGKQAALKAYVTREGKVTRPKPNKWDGGWRIIFFDIPEVKRHYRDFLREVLRNIGFREFQRSVWIYPFQVPSFLKDLLFEENIKKYTRFITTESIEFDRDLRKVFNLKEPRTGIF